MTAAWQARLPLDRVRRFVGWWAGELSEGLGGRSRTTQPWRLMFLRRGKGCEVFVRTHEGIEQVATAQTGSDQLQAELARRFGKRTGAAGPIVLRLQPGEAVVGRLGVPAAAREVMAPVVRNQIERLAPWPADKALFAYEIAGEAAEPGALEVHVTITGRNVVEGLVAELDELGYAPDIVDCGADAAAEPRINLLPRQSQEAERAGRLLVSLVGIALLLSVAIGAIGTIGLVYRTRELASLNADLEQLRTRNRPDRHTEGYARRQRRQTLLSAEKRAQPAMAIMLEALSRALPDDAWLSRLEVSQGSVTLAGKASNAATLIAPIEASPHFTDVQFSAPTTRAEGETQESFTITARIVAGRELN